MLIEQGNENICWVWFYLLLNINSCGKTMCKNRRLAQAVDLVGYTLFVDRILQIKFGKFSKGGLAKRSC